MRRIRVSPFMSLLMATAFVCGQALAQSVPYALNISGRLYQADGTAITQNGVDFKLELRDTAGSCVLYTEQHVAQDLSTANGGFSLVVGAGTSAQNLLAGGSTLSSALFANNGATGAFTGCGAGVNLASGSERVIRVYYDLGSGFVQMTPDVPVVASAYALVAQSLQGKTPSDFLQVNNVAAGSLNQTNADYAFSLTNWPKLKDLIDGASSQYLSVSPSATVDFNGQRLTNLASPATGSDAVNKTYADGYVGGKQVDVSAVSASAGNGDVLVWNQALDKWVAGTPAISFPLLASPGTTAPTAPSYSFTGDSSTGLFSQASGTLALATFGTARLTVDGLGRVGVGTTSPGAPLEISSTGGSSITLRDNDNLYSDAPYSTNIRGVDSSSNNVWYMGDGGSSKEIALAAYQTGYSLKLKTQTTTRVEISDTGDMAVNTNQLYVQQSTGNVGIGIASPGEKLTVSSGNIVASTGQVYSQAQTSSAASPLTFDTNSGNLMVWSTATASPTVNIHNMKAGGSYMLVVSGAGTGTVTINCFSDAGSTALPSSFIPTNGARTNGTLNKTVYTLISDGTNCLATWITGY